MIYEFPYLKVLRDSNIVIYGAGVVGQTYLHQLRQNKYCNVVCMVDKNSSNFKLLPVKVLDCDSGLREDFDYVVIANSSEEVAKDIISFIHSEYNIPFEKIIYENNYIKPINVVRDDDYEVIKSYMGKLACYKEGKYAIAINLSGGGMGDYIIRKNNVREVSSWNNNICIDLYVEESKKNFAEILFGDIENINMVIGSSRLYGNVKQRYLAAFKFTTFLIVDFFDEKKDIPDELVNKLNDVKKAFLDYGLKKEGLSYALHYARCEKDELNCYTAYNRYKAFQVLDRKTNIPLLEDKERDFLELGLENYITVNYGWDISINSTNAPAKVWPFEYLVSLVHIIKKNHTKINVVQIGVDDSFLIDGCKHLVGYDLEVIKYVLMNSKLHIDSEGGMVHLATQLGTRCAVLFGPTPVRYYGYPQNMNIMEGTCANCCWYVPDCVSCYRKLDKPDCMYNMKPEYVYEHILDELNIIG